MTLSEFKAWLDGFSEAIGEAPTPEQWAKVREKLATVSDWPFQPLGGIPQWQPNTCETGEFVPQPCTWISRNGSVQ